MFDDDLVDAWQARYRRWRNDYEAIIADAGAAVVVLPALAAREQARIRRCQVAVRSKHPDYDDEARRTLLEWFERTRPAFDEGAA